MAINMNLLGDGYDLENERQGLQTAINSLSKNRLGRKAAKSLQQRLDRFSLANEKGTGFLQQKLPFQDIRGMIDPQRSLSLTNSTFDFDTERNSLNRAFDSLRSRRGVAKSGFVDFARQEAEKSLEQKRQQSLFADEQRYMELTSTLEGANQDVMNANRRVLFDVFGDDLYNSIRSLRKGL